MTRWLRLEDARHLTKDSFLRAELAQDEPGIYVSDDLTRFKAYVDILERDGRGRLHRRQVTRTFRRDDVHDIDGERVSALDAARDWKSRKHVQTLVQREQLRDVTVNDVFDLFMKSRQLRPSTADNYSYSYRKHIAPAIGAWPLRNLTLHAVEEWFADVDTGPEARAKAARLLRALTNFAYRRGMIAEDPARILTIPGSTVRALRPDEIPTRDDVAKLVEAVGPRYRALILLLSYGGVRIGEAAALRVDRIDFARGRITIDQAATEAGGKTTVGPPKTSAGVRTLTAPKFLMEALRDHVERYPSGSGLVFAGPNGGPLRARNFRRRLFEPATKKVGLEGLHIHDLRHICASSLAAMGANAVEIAARLGHSNAGLTQHVYTHLLPSRDERLAALQDEAFNVQMPPQPSAG